MRVKMNERRGMLPFLLLVLLCFVAPLVTAAPSKSIVVLAQGRSGSSFLSSWFGSHPQVTYFLEPCSLVYLNGVHRDKTGTSCAAAIKRFLTCDFSLAAVTRNQRPYIPDVAVGFKGWGHQGGEEDVERCNQREATVAKELRCGVAWAEGKVDFPKTIILLRDPRAVVNSRVKGWPERATPDKVTDWTADPLGWDGKRGFPYKQSLKSLCVEQLKLRERASKESPERVLLVEYTDMLKDSEKLLKRVMDFSGLELVPEVVEHVQKSINGSCDYPDAPFSLCRTKVPLKDRKWKKQLPESELSAIMAVPECQQVINLYYSFEGDGEEGSKDEL